MFGNKAKALKEQLEQTLNSGNQPAATRINTRDKSTRQELRQVLLDGLNDSGASTKNHVNSRDVPVAETTSERLLRVAEDIRVKREAEQLAAEQAQAPAQLEHRVAGDGDLNSSFSSLADRMNYELNNNNGGY